jgi:hypothetical protein
VLGYDRRRRLRGRNTAKAWVLATLASGACADGAAGPGAATVVDSAGITIVTNVPGSIEAVETWSLAAEPAVDIGSGVDPDVALFRVTAVVPLDRGRVAVATNSPPQVLVLEPDGTVGSTLGREGDGPGEFASIASVVRLGADPPAVADSLGVWDDVRRRISVFTEDGRYVRDVDLSGLAPLTPIAAPNVLVPAGWTYLLPSSAGSLVLFVVGLFGPGEGVRRVEIPSYRVNGDGEELGRLGPFPGSETFMSSQTGMAPYPFGAETHGATSGDALVVGTAESPELRLYGPSGALERIVRWPDHDRTVGGRLLSDWNDFVDGWLTPMPATERATFRGILDHMGLPERFPAYDGLVTADTGETWVGAYAGQLTMPATPLNVRVPARRWLVFDGDGILAAGVDTPEGFEPHALREDRVWGVFKDELDVESVRAYEVVRGSGE